MISSEARVVFFLMVQRRFPYSRGFLFPDGEVAQRTSREWTIEKDERSLGGRVCGRSMVVSGAVLSSGLLSS
jgi:hypothetical protein